MTAVTVGSMVAPFRAVLFDLDDTLYSVTDLVTAAWRARRDLLSEWSLCPDMLSRAYEQATACGRVARTQEALTALGRNDVCPTWLYRLVTSDVPAALAPFPGTVDGLRALRSFGIRTGVITNGPAARQEAKLAALGLNSLFDIVVCCGDSVPLKPNPAPFLLSAEQLGVPPEQILMVGDRPDCDVAPALALGMGALRFVHGGHADLPDDPGTALSTSDPAVLWEQIRCRTAPAPAWC